MSREQWRLDPLQLEEVKGLIAIPMSTEEASNQPSESKADVTRSMLLIGVGYFTFLMCDNRDGIGKIALKLILKDHYHLHGDQIASFLAIVFMAWYFKPLAGLLTDSIPLFGTRRRHYLLLSTASAVFCWFAIGRVHSVVTLMWAFIGLNIAYVLGQTTLGGLLVERGKATQSVGRLTSLRNAVENIAVLIAGPIAGWFGSKVLGYTVGANIAILLLSTLFFFIVAKEAPEMKLKSEVWRNAFSQVKLLLRTKYMWIAAGLWFMVRFSPGFQTALFFYQTDTLKFSAGFIGLLSSMNGGGCILASIFYVAVCRTIPLRRLLTLGIVLNAIGFACYLKYNSHPSALVLEMVNGIVTSLAFIPLMDLMARATPKGCEALGYALLFSFGNISVSLSDIIGAKIYNLVASKN